MSKVTIIHILSTRNLGPVDRNRTEVRKPGRSRENELIKTVMIHRRGWLDARGDVRCSFFFGAYKKGMSKCMS